MTDQKDVSQSLAAFREKNRRLREELAEANDE